jgi:hypothetical protein
MYCLCDFGGCDLVFPRYQAAVRYREGDLLFASVHIWKQPVAQA